VIIALLGMLALRITPLTAIGLAAAATVLFTVLAAITMLPALLALFGTRLITRRQRRRLAIAGPRADPADSGLWGRWADLVARHKAAFSIVSLLIIAVLSIPTLSLRLAPPTQVTTRRGRPPAPPTTCSPTASAPAPTAPWS
jgi:RND superfamily putative drug exporter